MGRNKKGKVSTEHHTEETTSGPSRLDYDYGYEQNYEDVGDLYSYDNAAATPRSHPDGRDEALSLDLGHLSVQEAEPSYTATGSLIAYGSQGYTEQQSPPWETQQGRLVEELGAASTSALPQASLHSGTHRHGRRDRHSHRHHHHQESIEEISAMDDYFGRMAERQQEHGTAISENLYGGEPGVENLHLVLQPGEVVTNPFTYHGSNHMQTQFRMAAAPGGYGDPDGAPYDNPNDGPYFGLYGGYPAPYECRVYPTREFRVGRVLRVKWPEPKGTNPNAPKPPVTAWRSVMEDDVFTKDRRFVILETFNGHSLCAPIMTYGNHACRKPGVHPEHHGIIYTGQLQLLDDEPRLGYAPVAMESYLTTQSLLKESRVNYSKRYTVEHNVPVSFVGEIVKQDMDVIRNMRIVRRARY